jgi:NADH-quinone oxidoreductase subunit M
VLTFAPLLVMAFWIGLYPKPFFEILEQPVNQIVQTVRPGYPVNGNVNALAKPVAAPITVMADKTVVVSASVKGAR